jgi:predicted dehydrogenase
MRILLAGLGSVGQRHVRNLRAVLGDSVELMAYRVRGLNHVLTADMRIEAGDVEKKYGVTAFASLDAALAQRPDAVFVTNPNSLHMPIALAAVRAGCHLFIEKPISHTLDGIDELIAEVDRQRLVCLVGYQWRFHPALALVRCRIRSGAIGRLLSARLDFGEYLPDWHPYEDYRSMPVSRRDLGGGVILAQIHDLDYAYWFFGMPRRIVAMGGHLSHLDIDVEDVADILMECESAGRRFPVYVHQDCVRRPPVRGCSIDGDKGSIRLDLRAQTVYIADADGRQVESHSFAAHERNQMFLDELRHFLACVRGDATPMVTARDATMSLRMALAALDSIATGRTIDLS